ncbi:MAG: hypothetical protein E7071_02970 [Bacteroidales bacterium]|nr:hypothetical protein [Bacteroidales bacterium]
MKLRYMLGAFALLVMFAVGACSSDSDDVTPGTPGNTEIPDNTGGPDGPDNGDGGNDDGGNEGTPELPDDGNGDGTGDDGTGDDGTGDDGTGDDGSGDDPIDPEADVLTAKDLKGVWSGSDNKVYYFYANGKLYVDDHSGTYGVATWTLFETNQTIKVGETTESLVYKVGEPSTITFKEGLVLTATDETLPDETRFIIEENKELINSIGGMSSVTWIPEEV